MDSQVLKELAASVAEILGGRLVSVILYGSYAKGTQKADSDVDIALIVRDKISEADMDQLQDYLTDMDLKHGTLFSVVDIDIERFSRYRNVLPFYRNIQQEGIVLWTAA